ARGINGALKPAETRDRRLDQRLDFTFLSNVGAQELRLPASGQDFASDIRARLRAIGDRHLAARLRQRPGGRLADAAAAPGDDHRLSRETVHGILRSSVL